jgi:flagellar FliL protein
MQKSIIADFFSNYTEKELRSMGEIQIKEQLCELLNKQFVLGQIKSIYFNDYLFIK